MVSLEHASITSAAMASNGPKDLVSDVPVTGHDLPPSVRALLKPYNLDDVRWTVPEHQHLIVVEILTRGAPSAERWLWTQSRREAVRDLLRRFGGSGADNQGRAILRQKMDLTEHDVPPRPCGFVPWRG